MCSPISLTTIALPYSGSNMREAGTYKASSNVYTKTNNSIMNEYLQYEENKGWTVQKEGFYYISANMGHEVFDDRIVNVSTSILVNNTKLGNTLTDGDLPTLR